MPASRDDDVYQAKLAEQAERYEGNCSSLSPAVLDEHFFVR